METFTPLAGLLGGGIIGGAAALLLLAHGRIAGISGIWASLWRFTPGETLWRVAFIAGLVLGGALLLVTAPESMVNTVPRGLGTTAFAGLLVGLGTRLGGGCTSGHGICGIGRLSSRSLVATLSFTLTGRGAAALLGQQLLGGAL